MCTQDQDFRVNEKALDRARRRIGTTSCKCEGSSITLRAVTLRGWMHRKCNLGIERLTISKDGTVKLAPRAVLAKNIFAQVPQLEY